MVVVCSWTLVRQSVTHNMNIKNIYIIRFEFKNKINGYYLTIASQRNRYICRIHTTEQTRPISIFSLQLFFLFLSQHSHPLSHRVYRVRSWYHGVCLMSSHILSGCDGFHHSNINVKCKYTYGPTNGKIGANEMYHINKHNQRRRRQQRR